VNLRDLDEVIIANRGCVLAAAWVVFVLAFSVGVILHFATSP